jgi:3-hydroxybutyryl-CoA dehydratase
MTQHPTTRSVVPGDALPRVRRLVTQAMIDAYAALSGDRNPLHVDPAYAAGSPFGGTIAHGMMTLAIASQMLARWNPTGWSAGGEIDIAFVGPVRPGDEILTAGSVRAIELRDNRRFAACEISCAVGERTVLAGTAMCPLPATLEGTAA